MEKATPRCPTCKLGFINLGRLSAVHRFEDHLNQAHNIRCFECELNFSSQTHLRFHTQYQHDNPCVHCDSFCSDRCSEMLRVSLSKSQDRKDLKSGGRNFTWGSEKDSTECGVHRHVRSHCCNDGSWVQWHVVVGSLQPGLPKQKEHQDFQLTQRRTKLIPGWYQRAMKQLWTSCLRKLKV